MSPDRGATRALRTPLRAHAVSARWLARRLLGFPRGPTLRYIVPRANWSNDWDGHYITSEMCRRFGLPARVASHAGGAAGDLVHYGSLWTFLNNIGKPHNSRNRVVATVFHGDRSSQFPELCEAMDRLVEHADDAELIVTSCKTMADRLERWGVPRAKLRRIPLGVDLSIFGPPSPEARSTRRRALGIPQDAVCVGSFQKDGNGWGEGDTPKLIKGPDVFLDVVDRLKDHCPLFVLLTGPARGFVKRGLERLGVPYRHDMVKDYRALPAWYHCLDLYVVTSREEGGPKAVLECLATGVPLISTKVGLAPDIIDHGRNGFLAEIDNVDTLAGQAAVLVNRPDLREGVARNGLFDAARYDWSQIAARYYHEVYRPMLADMGK